MGPDGISQDAAQYAIPDLEILRAFFEQDAAGGVIAAALVARPAVLHRETIDPDMARARDDDGESRDVDEVQTVERNILATLHHDAIARIKIRKRDVPGRQARWSTAPRPNAFDA